jgi:hypothetical protein
MGYNWSKIKNKEESYVYNKEGERLLNTLKGGI